MSVCIIPVRHQTKFISYYMGKLRFTLTNIVFWLAMILSCLLAENYALFSSAPRSGLDLFSLYLITFSVIGLLVIYYLLEHKKNGLSFDKILLPSLIILGSIMIWTIFRQGERTFTNWTNDGTFEVSFTLSQRFLAASQVVIWFGLLYAMVFVYNRFRLNLESYRWIPKIFLLLTIAFVVIDFFYEFETIAGIFAGTYVGAGVEFIFGNANVWALVIFAGIISALILSFKRFNWYYFSSMICLFCYLVLTTSATAIYVSLIVLLAYPLYEVFMPFKKGKKRILTLLAIYFGVVLTLAGLIALFVSIGVPMFANFWHFIDQSIFHKDFLTITGRTTIWTHIIDLLKGNPLDFIFGLGHQTGSEIYHIYNANYMPVKSAHNAIMEVFLRYGLLGAIIYCFMLIGVVICLIIHIKKKRYRFAFIYGLAFLAIFAHSIAESTNIFTPNIGGVYFGLYFVLPVINVLQSKKFKEIKDEVTSYKVDKQKVNRSFYFLTFVLVLVIAITLKIINSLFIIDTLSSLIIFIDLISIIFFALILTKNKALCIINDNILSCYIRRLEASKDEK